MGLNIKNEEAHRLETEVAELAGETLTQAVTTALRDRLAHLKQHHEQRKMQRTLAIMDAAREVRRHLTGPIPDPGEELYDEHSLPN
ncbi:MAG: type II toxin-antitoxin system VapB family antitoxin [Chitinophagales bacterium]|nr:type II toxin-antitoxin system VapB family antitoxin [Hyphomicrobiales bacterium]